MLQGNILKHSIGSYNLVFFSFSQCGDEGHMSRDCPTGGGGGGGNRACHKVD